jgi:hypothetical protein
MNQAVGSAAARQMLVAVSEPVDPTSEVRAAKLASISGSKYVSARDRILSRAQEKRTEPTTGYTVSKEGIRLSLEEMYRRHVVHFVPYAVETMSKSICD